MSQNENNSRIQPFQVVHMGYPSRDTNVIMQQTNIFCANCGHHVFTTVMPVIPIQRVFHTPPPPNAAPPLYDNPSVHENEEKNNPNDLIDPISGNDDNDDNDDNENNESFVVPDDVIEYEEEEEEKEISATSNHTNQHNRKRDFSFINKRPVPTLAPASAPKIRRKNRFPYSTKYHRSPSVKLDKDPAPGIVSWDDLKKYEEEIWKKDFRILITRGFYRRLVRPALMGTLANIGNQCHAKTMQFQKAFQCIMESTLDVRHASYGFSIPQECYACGKPSLRNYTDWEIWDERIKKGYPLRLGNCCALRLTAILEVMNALWEDSIGAYHYSIFRYTSRATAKEGKAHLQNLMEHAKVVMNRVAENRRGHIRRRIVKKDETDDEDENNGHDDEDDNDEDDSDN